MSEITAWGCGNATEKQRRKLAGKIVRQALDDAVEPLTDVVAEFLRSPLGPGSFFAFELALVSLMRALGRAVLEGTLNLLEPDDPQRLPKDLHFECGGYRRRGKKTRNQHVATRFGTISLWRRGYRSWEAGDGSIFPLEMLLGLVEGITPALADQIGRWTADAGASQQAVLTLLRTECGVKMGVKRLRAFTQQLSESMTELREASYVEALVAALSEANESRGSRKPVLSVGRDGITLREYKHSLFEVATAATVSVFDRAGKRIKTVYLAWPPELGQATMDEMLTSLLKQLFTQYEGPLPRLAYVADSGANEEGYFDRVLRRMDHPVTGKRLCWYRVTDFFHVSERIWAMADALFTKNEKQRAAAWAYRMLKSLKKPSGASRVLHSAASLFHRRTLGKTRKKNFWLAYNYIRRRTRTLRYNEYASLHIPLGSGVTEAACKTIFTQRLKLSGMRWQFDGAKTILGLRTLLLSGQWNTTYAAHLIALAPAKMRPYKPLSESTLKNAA